MFGMNYNSTAGKIFKLTFPFTDHSSSKARPALAVSDPDVYGDIEFVFISTKKASGERAGLKVPAGLLPLECWIHTEKKALLHQSVILKELAVAPLPFYEKVLKQLNLNETERYYRQIHQPQQKTEFVPGKTRVNYAGRVFDEKELVNLVDSSLEFWLTYGRYSREFETKLSEYLDIQWSLLVNSGSSANLLAFMALTSPLLKERQVNRDDEIITVACGFPTTVAPILQYGAVPVFVDMELKTANIDVDQLEAALSDKTKAVMLAHTLGNPFDVKAVKAFCDKHNLWLIEDNCDALGSRVGGQLTGTFGDIGTSSFYPPHHMTMGEGGAVYTNNPLLKKIMLSIRDWGRDCWCDSGVDDTCGCRFSGQHGTLPEGYDHKYVYSHFGYNLKVSDMQAAIGNLHSEMPSLFLLVVQSLNLSFLQAGQVG